MQIMELVQHTRGRRRGRREAMTIDEAMKQAKLLEHIPGHEAAAVLATEVERLQSECNEFASAVERLGVKLFGSDEWRNAKAPWWSDLSRLIQRHEAADAEGGHDG
jgi:hypothetical protein